jgi:hypothetical protein
VQSQNRKLPPNRERRSASINSSRGAVRDLARRGDAYTDRYSCSTCGDDFPRAPALLRNSRKTECGAIGSWIDSGVRAAPFALLCRRNGARGLAAGHFRPELGDANSRIVLVVRTGHGCQVFAEYMDTGCIRFAGRPHRKLFRFSPCN